MQDLSKRYWKIKYSLAIFEIFYTILLLFIFLNSGFSQYLSVFLFNLIRNNFLIIALYLLVISLIYYVLNFPFHLYQSYILEKQFLLSHQRLSCWLKDEFKQGVIFYIISLILIEFFYFSLDFSPKRWWLIFSLFWIFLSIVLAKILPIFIIPLFFKYKRLTDEELRKRIIKLAEKMKIKILDVFEIDLSKKTLKANAAFVGLGKTKRVILADTLRGKYSPEEIELILAHEFSHYRMKHILKLLNLEAVSIILNFYFIFKTIDFFLKKYNFLSLKELGSLPLLFIYLILWGIITTPFKNFISRIFERNADILAIKSTGFKEAFVSVMEKLAQQNLADRQPHPIIKFFFFDHPPIEERITLAKDLN